MVQKMNWFERKFAFNLPVWMFPNIVERLHGSPARAEEIIADIPENKLTVQEGNQWSIQEHIGHLLDLESLWMGRINDFINGKNQLRPADLTNRKTHEANHNQSRVEDLLKSFRETRFEFTGILFDLEDSMIEREALHPRLEQPMRLLDLIFFTAEHDDHHFAQIRRLLKNM